MAVVKATYTKAPKAIKASVRYYTQRPTREGVRGTRSLFGERGSLTNQDVYAMIGRAQKGTYFYRLIISPDPAREDTGRDINLERLTRITLARYAKKRALASIPFAAVSHTDHTDKRHVHVVACFSRKLTRSDLLHLRELSTAEAVLQRRQIDRGLKVQKPRQSFHPAGNKKRARSSEHVVFRAAGSSLAYPSQPKRLCPGCRASAQLTWRDARLVCQSCGYEPKRKKLLLPSVLSSDADLEMSIGSRRGN